MDEKIKQTCIHSIDIYLDKLLLIVKVFYKRVLDVLLSFNGLL